MRLSIAMATYNGARYLERQLDSFLAQTRRPDELVVCDDNSDDSTVRLLEDFNSRAPFAVRIIRNPENLGYIRNFEQALSLAHGDVVFLSDQDDAWFESKLERVASFMERQDQAMLVINDAEIADGNLEPQGVTKLQNTRAAGLGSDGFVTGCCCAVRRAWLQKVLPFPETVASHDAWINTLAIALGVRGIIEEPLQYYRRHEDNVSSSVSSAGQPLTRMDLLRYELARQKLEGGCEGWPEQMKILRAYEERLRKLLDEGGQGYDRKLAEQSIQRFRSIRLAWDQRLQITQQPRWRRWVGVFGLYAAGAYGNFRGVRSAAKDVVRSS